MSETSEPTIRLGWWLSSEEHDPRDLVAHAQLAESAGFETAMISDHLQPWVRHQANAPYVWTVIGGIAATTEELELGTGVTAMVQRNHPITVAQAATTAAVMLEDRFFLGVGIGERLNEQTFGARWPRPAERLTQLEEAVALLRRLFSGETVNNRGESWNVENLRLATRPASPPPIYLAAGGPRGAAAAGNIGDGMIGVAADAQLVDIFRTSGGSGKRCLAQVHLSIAATMDKALDQAWEWWPNGVVPPQLFGDLAKPEDFESIATAIGRATINETVVCATDSAPVINVIDKFIAAGFDTIYLHQVGHDQRRLVDLATTELLDRYRNSQ